MKKGRLIFFYGDGRGKTSAAYGLALRCLGRGGKVYVARFMKGRASGEQTALAKQRRAKVESFGPGSFMKGAPRKVDLAEAERGVSALAGAVESGSYTMLVADELLSALACRLLTVGQIAELAAKRGNAALVMTGSKAPKVLMDMADDVTLVKKVKHSYDKGRKAERGLEF